MLHIGYCSSVELKQNVAFTVVLYEMTTSFEDLLCYLGSAMNNEHVEHTNDDLAWERLSQIELFEELFLELFQ